MSKKQPAPKKRSLLSATLVQIESLIVDLSSALKFLLTWPLREIGMLKWAVTGSSVQGETKRKVGWKQILLMPVYLVATLLALVGKVLISPAELLIGVSRGKSKQSLWAIPGILALAAFVFIGINQQWFGNFKANALRKSANAAFQGGDFELANMKYSELQNMTGGLEPDDELNWSLSLSRVGESEQSQKLMHKLAPGPGNPPGYRGAHELVAIHLARRLNEDNSPLVLQALRWHLSNSGDAKTPELNKAWADYFLQINDRENALKYLKSAAEIKPEYIVLAADIYASQGNKEGQMNALRQGRDAFQTIVTNNPEDPRHRIMLTKIQFRLGEYDEVEKLLVEGLDKREHDGLRTALSDFYLQRFKMSKGTFEERFGLIKQSLDTLETYLPSHDALIRFYRAVDNESSKQKIKSILAEQIQKEESAGIAHFALSNIYWSENQTELSLAHMEKAFALDARFSVVSNNLAWLLAHAEEPDLDRAMELARFSSEKEPNNGRYRDTLGTILMKQNRYDEALVEFHKALRTIKNKKMVHGKMADIYYAMNKIEFAKEHQDKAAKTN